MAELKRLGLGYVYEPDNTNLRLSFDHIQHHTDTLKVEILVEAKNGDGMYHHLKHVHPDILSEMSRDRATKAIAAALGPQGKDLNVPALVETLSMAVMRRERAGDPFVTVGGDMPVRPKLPDLIEKLLPRGMVTMLYAAGKTGKGWMGTAAAVAVKTSSPLAGLVVGRAEPLYLDWEDSREIFNERVHAVARGFDLKDVPPVRYRKMRGPLRHQLHPICAEIDGLSGHGRVPVLVVVDSVMAAAGRNEGQGAEEVAMSFYDALRLFPDDTTVLLIHHKPADPPGTDYKQMGKAYGSVFFTNYARSVWELRKDQKPGAKQSLLGLYHAFANHTEQYQPFAIRVDFGTHGKTSFHPDELSQSDELSKPLSMGERVYNILALSEPMLVSEISSMLGETDASVRGALVRGRNKLFTLNTQNQTWAAVPRTPALPYKEEW